MRRTGPALTNGGKPLEYSKETALTLMTADDDFGICAAFQNAVFDCARNWPSSGSHEEVAKPAAAVRWSLDQAPIYRMALAVGAPTDELEPPELSASLLLIYQAFWEPDRPAVGMAPAPSRRQRASSATQPDGQTMTRSPFASSSAKWTGPTPKPGNH